MRANERVGRSVWIRNADGTSCWIRLVIGLALITSLGACIADPDFVTGEDKKDLLQAYRAQSQQALERRAHEEAKAIRELRLSAPDESRLPRLSVDLVQADLNRVMARILSDPNVAYRNVDVRFHGRISARFRDRPLVEGLNLILAGTGILARADDQVLSFGYDDAATDGGEADGSSLTISREIALRHLSSSDVVTLLENLYPRDYGDEENLSVGNVPELNSVFLSGSAEQVTEAAHLVARADRPVAHVIIEALVVDIDTSSVESLGLSLADGASGSFSAVSLVPGQTGGNLVATFSELAGNAAQVTATVDFLAAQNMAQVLARPYVATQSTKPATIQIVDDQFARVDTSGDDSSIITTDSITAGISMQITPIVMANESIRLDLTLEDSRFSATAGDIIVAKQRSTASSSMIVQSGQTIVIGGLNSKYRLTENSGIPWLRRIPLLNAFAGETGAVESRIELVVYLTPYIWIPGLDTPLPLPGHPPVAMPDLLSMETGGTAPE